MVRRNRLCLLHRIRAVMNRVAIFRQSKGCADQSAHTPSIAFRIACATGLFTGISGPVGPGCPLSRGPAPALDVSMTFRSTAGAVSGLFCTAMKPQRSPVLPDAVISLDYGSSVRRRHGARAAKLARTDRPRPGPAGVALSFDCVRALADGGPMPALPLTSPPDACSACAPARAARMGRPRACSNVGSAPHPAALERASTGRGARLFGD